MGTFKYCSKAFWLISNIIRKNDHVDSKSGEEKVEMIRFRSNYFCSKVSSSEMRYINVKDEVNTS